VSLTAGFCEEFLFRGYLIWVFSPWLGWWGAAALSLTFFATGHAYQGWNGVLRTGIVGGLFTLVVAISGSLWPAIALHALHDLGGGIMAGWCCARARKKAAWRQGNGQRSRNRRRKANPVRARPNPALPLTAAGEVGR
jgi:membrane protease YdiL (CAAX protease family)